MVYKNRSYKHSRIVEKTFRRIVCYFSLDLSASDTACLTGITVRFINNIYIMFLHRLAQECEQHSHLADQIEMIAPHKSNRRKARTQDGRSLHRYRRRWRVEGLFAWLQNFRRLITRH